jgi:hypothetical protein
VAGCAGPSKARYRELLGECREHQREYVRLLKAYSEIEPMQGCEPFLLNGHEGFTCARKVEHPEPAFGAVGFGEGGGRR